ncbi:ubiquitin binding protein [Lactarius tabidus]
MSTLSSWLWGTTQLDEAIDKATSELLPTGSEDIALNLEICDQIRSKSAQPKEAMRSLKRRLNHKNPNVQLLALTLTDVCVKNGGDHFLVEIASREFMDNLVSILKTPSLHRDVKGKILRYVQTWAISFKGKYHLNYVEQVYKSLKAEGFTFPPEDLAVAGSALVDTQTAPEWIDSDVCLRCRDPFSFTNRKHHCRNCGRVFDQKCSSKSLPLPNFGITQEVRVCDSCHKDLTRHKDKVKHRRSSHSAAAHNTFSDLERAIQLSLEEAGAHGHGRPGYVSHPPDSWSEPPLVEHNSRRSTQAEEEEDPDLKAAIEASLREANAPRPSAPTGLETPRAKQSSFSYAGQGPSQPYLPSAAPAEPSVPALPNYDLAPSESDAIITFSQTIEQVQAHGGGNMSRFPEVTQLLDNANNLRPKLARSLDDAGRKEELLTDMNNKLAQAVKLYDHILTQQVAQPTWRQQTTSPVGQHYGQWNHGPPAAAVQPPHTPATQPWHQPTSVYAPPQAYKAPTSVDAPYSPPTHSPQQAWTQPSYMPSDTSPPVPASQVNPHYQSVPTPQSPVPQQYQYAQPTQPVSIPPPVPQAQAQAPTRTQQPVAPVPVQPPTVQQQVSSPPPVHQQPPSRHNTLAHAAYGPPPTISAQQYAHRPAPAPALPSFPSVPTAPPTIPYGSYESASSAVEQPQKEALLIEL